MKPRFFYLSKEIDISKLDENVALLLFSELSKEQIDTVVYAISKKKEERDFLFRVYMGNIVDQFGRQYSPSNQKHIFDKSWVFVDRTIYNYIYNQYLSLDCDAIKDLHQNVAQGFSITSKNNRSHPLKQHEAIHNKKNGAKKYIHTAIKNTVIKMNVYHLKNKILDFNNDKNAQIISVEDNFSFFHNADIIDTTKKYLGDIAYKSYLFPSTDNHKEMLCAWREELDSMLFHREWLSTKFTAVNHEKTIERIIAYRQAVRLDDFSYIENEFDQFRRCKRNLVKKLLNEVLCDLQKLEHYFQDNSLQKCLRVLIPEVFDTTDWKNRVNATTMIKKRLDFDMCVEDLMLPRLDQLLSTGAHPKQVHQECCIITNFLLLVIVIQTFQKNTSLHRNLS